jgi:hypothetical protein
MLDHSIRWPFRLTDATALKACIVVIVPTRSILSTCAVQHASTAARTAETAYEVPAMVSARYRTCPTVILTNARHWSQYACRRRGGAHKRNERANGRLVPAGLPQIKVASLTQLCTCIDKATLPGCMRAQCLTMQAQMTMYHYKQMHDDVE